MRKEKETERKFLRVPVGTRAVFTWGSQEGAEKRGKGVTRDISAGGIYLYTKTPPPVGSSIKLDMLLPKVRGAMEALRMKVMGRVVRVHPPDEEERRISGFAAVTDRFVLQDTGGRETGKARQDKHTER